MKRPEAELQALVGEWARKAAQDFAGAERLAAEGSELRELAVFHAQQAAEKYLKALMIHHRVLPPKTHDLTKLLLECVAWYPDLGMFEAECKFLSPLAVISQIGRAHV